MANQKPSADASHVAISMCKSRNIEEMSGEAEILRKIDLEVQFMECEQLSDAEQERLPYGSSRSRSSFHEGLLKARACTTWPTVCGEKQLKISLNLRCSHTVPNFNGCPTWIKPLEYQVNTMKTYPLIELKCTIKSSWIRIWDIQKSGCAPYSQTSRRIYPSHFVPHGCP